MATNPDYEYSNAMKEYMNASSDEEKLKALRRMLSKAPKHKSAEKLVADIKNRIAKLKKKLEKQRKQKKGRQFTLRKEGAATIALVGVTNTGKSTLLNKLTGAKVKFSDYEYTTKNPEVGIFDYHGIKLQIVEIPSLFENFEESERGPSFLSLIRQSDLVILFFKTPEEKNMLTNELNKMDIDKPTLIYNNQENIGDLIWGRLPLIKVRTKIPGRKPDFPPVALKKDSAIKALAEHVHKDFLKKFKEKDKNNGKFIMPWARVWGKSVKFQGQRCSLNHKLEEGDIVELHLK